MFRLPFQVAVLVLSLFAGSSLAAEADVPLKITQVTLFKNGLGYFTSTATLPAGATTLRFGQLPIPSHGTFWVGYEAGLPVKGVFTRLETISRPQTASDITGLLEANVGRNVVLYSRYWGAANTEDPKPVKGKLLSVNRGEPATPASPYVMSARPESERNQYYGGSRPAVAIIQTEEGTAAISTDSVQRLLITGGKAATQWTHQEKIPVLRLELAQPAPGWTINVSYLAKGITWAPSYRIDLSDAKTAAFTAKAIIINEVADLDAVKVDLVTGYPNLLFSDIQSPIALSSTLGQFLQALQQGRSENRGSPVVAQQAVMGNLIGIGGGGGGSNLAPQYGTAATGQQAEDLFLYPVKELTLKRGETAMLPLFSAKLPYEHVYTWKIPDMLDERDQYRHPSADSNTRPPQEEVWHICRLTNTGKMPLTTAPAEFIKDGQIVGQDICYYTNPGTQTDIRINRALRIAAEHAEFEVRRERNAAQFYGYNYDKVTVRGVLDLTSSLPDTVHVEVTKLLSGDVLENKEKAEVIDTAKGLRAVNARHQLVWKIDLAPGKMAKLTYDYVVLVRP